MVRKRSLASVLYEDNTSSDRNRNSRNKSISNILGKELTSNQPSNSSRLVLFLNISSEDEMEEMEEISIESEEESTNEFSNIFESYSSPNYDPDEPGPRAIYE
ncbi:hypothetical protein Glove_308g16 [Diversispora epigaea]|uniref:Uncharacterized protein n=1 Tax=Diversispora epigaea TaxID=1348612 RepID=A0A397HYN4_9GLOM|nr:hypothetical protein Glove_308g16 [Diversispora epigaea]